MLVPGRTKVGTSYRYGFQGHEKDDEIKGEGNSYDFGGYGLDVRTGRRFQNDPVKNPSLSPYAVFNNNPLYYTDPTGMKPDDWIKDKNGKYSYRSDVNEKSQTPAGYEYVGKSINNVFSDFKSTYPFKAFFGQTPDFGDISEWSGEINTPQDHSSLGFNWTYLRNRGKFVEKMTFEVANGFNIFAEMIKGHQAGVDMTNLDGTPTTTGQGIFGLYNTALLFSPFKGISSGEGSFAYRSLTSANAQTLARGEGIYAKSVEGAWTLEQHLIHGSSPKAFINNPWIATSKDINVARSFSSGNGLIRIDLSKLPSSVIEEGYLSLPRTSPGYHYSLWQQEVSIFQHIPQSAIKVIK